MTTLAPILADLGIDAPAAKADQVYMVAPERIHSDPARFQFRRTEEKNGIARARLEGKWNPLLHGKPLLAYEDTDGKLFVVDGHHRLEMAKRLNTEGKGPEALLVRVLRARDGITVDDARLIGAYINFAEEFREAKPHSEQDLRDAARAFREVHAGKAHKELLPEIRIEGALALAYEAGALTNEAFAYVERGEVPVSLAAKVLEQAETPTEQVTVMEIIKNKLPARQAESWQARVLQAPDSTGISPTL